MAYKIHPDKVYLAVFAIFLVGAVVKYSAQWVCDSIWSTDAIDAMALELERPAAAPEIAVIRSEPIGINSGQI